MGVLFGFSDTKYKVEKEQCLCYDFLQKEVCDQGEDTDGKLLFDNGYFGIYKSCHIDVSI